MYFQRTALGFEGLTNGPDLLTKEKGVFRSLLDHLPRMLLE